MSRTVGWYVQIPKSLRDKFDALYPGRRNKKILTITAIEHAIAKAPKSLYNLYKEPDNGVDPAEGDVFGDCSDSSRGTKDGPVD